MTSIPTIRRRRATCYWEPTYNPSLVGKLESAPWPPGSAVVSEKKHLVGDSLVKLAKDGRHVFENQTFTQCDFQGFFEFETQVVLKRCSFIECDLALTTWENVKFSSCTFNRTSIGQTIFRSCEFRDCTWTEIGFSPNETSFERTLVTNPDECVASAFTTSDDSVLSARNVDIRKQLYKLEVTRATIARLLLRNLQDVGDEPTYYQAVRTFELTQAKARFARASYETKTGKGVRRLWSAASATLWWLEKWILHLFGALNGWGASVARPAVALVLSMLLFALLYWLIDENVDDPPIIRSFDIASLAGYTNYGTETGVVLYIQALQLAISAILYSITLATVVSRFSRVRA